MKVYIVVKIVKDYIEKDKRDYYQVYYVINKALGMCLLHI